MKKRILLIAAALLGASAYIFSVVTREETTWLNIACGLWFIGMALIAFVLFPYIPDFGFRFPRSRRSYSKYVHPTAEATEKGVVVHGDVGYLQNNMFRYVSGGKWTKLKAGGWLFENQHIEPEELAEEINRWSHRL